MSSPLNKGGNRTFGDDYTVTVGSVLSHTFEAVSSETTVVSFTTRGQYPGLACGTGGSNFSIP